MQKPGKQQTDLASYFLLDDLSVNQSSFQSISTLSTVSIFKIDLELSYIIMKCSFFFAASQGTRVEPCFPSQTKRSKDCGDSTIFDTF